MRAWVLDEEGAGVRVADVAEPQVKGGGAVLTVLAAHVPGYTGVLTTGARGMLATPLVLGPACVGRVVSVAEDVFNVAPGDVVLDTGLLLSGSVDDPEELIVGWTGIGGRGEATPTVTAMRQAWPDGTFAERTLRPASTLVRLPGAEEFGRFEHLAFLGWLALAVQALERAGQGAGDEVAVVGGSGQLGGAVVLAALARGASRVVALGRNPTSLARVAGVDARVATVTLSGQRATDTAAVLATGGEVDVVVDALGAAPTIDATMAGYDALRTDGTMVLLGGVRHDLPISYTDLVHRRLTLRGSWMAPPSAVQQAWRAVRSGLIDLSVLQTSTTGLEDPAAALETAAATSGLGYLVLVPGT